MIIYNASLNKFKKLKTIKSVTIKGKEGEIKWKKK